MSINTQGAPNWVPTPPECVYSLDMTDSGGDNVQYVEMTREEFIVLKAHLATLRGLPLADVAGESEATAVHAPVPTAAPDNATPDPITQHELEACAALRFAALKFANLLSKRIDAGSAVEAGPIVSESDGAFASWRADSGFGDEGLQLRFTEPPTRAVEIVEALDAHHMLRLPEAMNLLGHHHGSITPLEDMFYRLAMMSETGRRSRELFQSMVEQTLSDWDGLAEYLDYAAPRYGSSAASPTPHAHVGAN